MPELATVLRGARVVLAHGRPRVDLGIAPDGSIAAIAEAGTLGAGAIVDCDGLEALPGAVDRHVHLATFFGGVTTRDDFFSGTAPNTSSRSGNGAPVADIHKSPSSLCCTSQPST